MASSPPVRAFTPGSIHAPYGVRDIVRQERINATLWKQVHEYEAEVERRVERERGLNAESSAPVTCYLWVS